MFTPLKEADKIINLPVAADASACALYQMQPSAIAHIQLAQKWGLGTADFSRLTRYQAVL